MSEIEFRAAQVAEVSYPNRTVTVIVAPYETPTVINTATGDYRFCCNGTLFSGRGTLTIKGSTYKLEHNPADRRVLATIDESVHRGIASIQSPPGMVRCTITDTNTRNNNCACP